MPAVEPIHTPTPEEIMEYLDGEGTDAARATIGAHLASCAACQAIAAEQRGISEHVQAWTVDRAPESLQPPAATRGRVLLRQVGTWRGSRVVLAGLTAAAALLVAFSFNARTSPESSLIVPFSAGADKAGRVAGRPEFAGEYGRGGAVGSVLGGLPGSPPPPAVPTDSERRAQLMPSIPSTAPESAAPLRAPAVIRTATLRIVAKDFNGVRASVEGIVSQAGGFVDQMTVTGDNAAARELRGTVRVPGEKMADALARLRQIGQVVEDTQGSQDVTDQIVDLDARMNSARATEKRLTELLANRTGKLSDVLEVERELTRVRLDIERLDAEKTNVGRRVSYATIDVTISEERKAGLAGPLSLATRIRIAAADGLESALESVTATVLFILRAGPTLVLWSLAAGIAWVVARRLSRGSPKPRVSE
jgi:anti-sigma factor RsiW